MSLPNVYVFYHYPCHDGFLAQLLIQRILKGYATVTTCQLQHGAKDEPDLSLIKPGSDVLFVDIAPKPEFLAQLEAHENVATINVWDHHIDYRNVYKDYEWKTQILPNFFDITIEHARINEKTTLWFCNEISGSKLAPIAAGFWNEQNADHLEMQLTIGSRSAEMYTHPIVVHASDYDTWTKAYPTTDAVFAYYRNFKYEDEAPWHQLLDRITSFDQAGYRDIVMKGESMLEAIQSMAEKLADGETPRELDITVPSGTYSGVICNAYSLLANDLAEAFRERGYDFAIMYNITPTKIAISIRSKPGIPANEIAQKWGGGGHAESAGAGIVGTTKMIHWLKEFAFDPNS